MAEPARDLNPYDPDSEHGYERPNLRSLEGGSPNSSPRPDQNPFRVVKPDEEDEPETSDKPNLKVLEGNPDVTSDTASQPNLSVVNGTKKKNNFLSNLPGSASTKRRAGAAGGLIVAGIISAVIGFFSLLPLKVIHIVSNLQHTFAASTERALNKEMEKLFEGYMQRVVRSVLLGQCKSTIDNDCTVGIDDKGPVGRLYKTWHDKRLEKTLGEKYGLIIGKRGSQLFATLDGVDIAGDPDLRAVASGDKRFFSVVSDKRGKVSPTQLRQRIDALLKDASLWEKAHFRFKYNDYLRERGIKLCVIACKIDDKFTYPLKDKLLTAKATFLGRVITPLDSEYGLLLECVLSGNCDDLTALQKMTPEELERTTPIEQKVRANLLEGASEEDISRLVSKTDAAATKSFTDLVVDASVRKLVSIFAGDVVGEQAGKLTTKAIPIVGWALLGAQLETSANQIGPAFHKISYQINVAAADQTYAMFLTDSAEQKSGHNDQAEHGSFVDWLGSNLSGSKDDRVDVTQAPLYDFLFTSKDAPNSGPGLPTSQFYKCNDGSSVRPGKLVCPEEQFGQGVLLFDAISNATNLFPWQPFFAGIANKVNILIGKVTGPALNAAFNAFCTATPGCDAASRAAEEKVAQFSQWFIFSLIANPFSGNMSGARTFDMMAAGAMHTYSRECMINLGCMKLDDQTISAIQNAQLADDKAEFESHSMFDRMFDTSSPYSMISKVAVAMPTSLPTAINDSVATMTSPLSHITDVFSSVFAGNKAFAAIPPQANPFGISMSGIPDDNPVFDADPQTYLNQHCPGMTVNDFTGDIDGPMGKIRADWENNQGQENPKTGEVEMTTTQPCLLIGTAIQDSGVVFDTSFAPKGSLTPDPTQ